MMQDAVIVDVVRTPSGRGKPGGSLSEVHPVDLAAGVLTAVLERNGLESRQIDDVILGCVSQVGDQSMNIARQAVLAAGFDESVPATTIDRQCGSSQQAAHFAAQGVMPGAYDIVIAAGVESMSRVPLGSSARGGSPSRGLAARYPEGLVNQGVSAELIARELGLRPGELDAFAAESHAVLRMLPRVASSIRSCSRCPRRTVTCASTRRSGRHDSRGAGRVERRVPDRRTTRRVSRDVEWTITAGNSSPLTDGASAALHHERGRAARELGLAPRARFHAFAVVGDDPLLMLTGPIPATHRMLARPACRSTTWMRTRSTRRSRPCRWPGSPSSAPIPASSTRGAARSPSATRVGASGTRLLGTLVDHLEATGGRYGLQTMCEAGGMANATIIERL